MTKGRFSILHQWHEWKAELKTKNKAFYLIVDWGSTIIIALILALIFRHFVMQVSVVPTGSMIPTFNKRDRCLVNRFIYKFQDPKRGDIVVFKNPTGKGDDYVKRCIGLPNEKIKIKHGIVYINSKPLIIPGAYIQYDSYNMDERIIPKDQYFVLGDNRANSQDSRFIGYIPRNNLTGKAFFSFWPFNRMRILH